MRVNVFRQWKYVLLQIVFFRRVFAEENNDCFLLDHASPEFRVSPGHYEAGNVTLEECKLLCKETNFTYAALMAYEFCLCSFSNEDVITKDCSEVCGDGIKEEECAQELPDLIKMAEIEIEAIWSVSLKTQVETETSPDIHSKVNFEVQVTTSVSFEVILYVGDGTSFLSTDKSFSASKAMRLPGTYTAKALADDQEFLQVIMDEKDFDVPDPVVQFRLNCPAFVELSEDFFCNVTFFRGSHLVMSVSFDEEDAMDFEVPDTVMTAIGEAAPIVTNVEHTESSFSDVVLLAHSDMPFGNILGFEYYAAKEGNLEILVMTRKCREDERSCSCQEQCQDSSITDCGEKIFDFFSKNCVDESDQPDYYQNTKRKDLKLKNSFNVEIPSPGYQYLEISPEELSFVTPLDVLGFKQGDSGKLFHRNATDQEKETATADTSEDGRSLDVRHFLRALIVTPTNFSFKGSLTEAGNHSVVVKLSSEASEGKDEKSSYVFAGTPLEGVELSPPSKCVAVNDEAAFEVVIQKGSSISLLWRCSNEEKKDGNLDAATGEPYFENFRCQDQGNFSVYFQASNVWKSENRSAEFCCLHPIGRDWTVNTNSPQIYPPGIITSSLKYSGESATFPHGAQVDISYETAICATALGYETESLELVENCSLPGAGSFVISWNILNSISSEIFTSEVILYAKLGILEVRAQYPGQIIDPTIKKSNPPNLIYVPVEVPVTFICEIIGESSFVGEKRTYIILGAAIFYTAISESAGIDTNSSKNVVEHTFDEADEWKIHFRAGNPVELSNIVILYIRSVSSTRKLQLTASTAKASLGDVVHFEISFESSDKFTCITFDPGDGSEKIAFGNKEICDVMLSDSPFTWTDEGKDEIREKREVKEKRWEDDKTMKVSYAYESGEIFIPVAKAFNELFSSEDATTVEIIAEINDIWIERNSTNIRNPQKFFRSQDFRLETTALLTEDPSHTYTMKWNVYKISNSGSILAEIDISSIKSQNCSAIRIPPRYLEVGLYKFVYSIIEENQNSEVDETEVISIRSCYTYVKIMATPLIPMIIKGGATYFVRGYGQNVNLEASIYSEDPDDLSDKNFQVSWSCRRFERSKVLPEMEDDHPSGSPSSTFINQDLLDDALQEEGCFLKADSSELEGNNPVLNTEDLKEFGALYEITAVITKDIREAETHIFLDVIEQIPPGIIVMCERKSACRRHADGFLINPSSWISIKAECIEDCPEGIVFVWEVYGVDKSSAFAISEWLEYVTVDEDRLGINRTMFERHPSTKKYHVKVSGEDPQNPSRPKGVAELYLFINDPPTPGSCTLNATAGLSLIDVFSVTFSGWSDPDRHSIVDYSVYAMIDGKSNHIRYGIKTYAELILPAGEIMVMCAVKDSEGAISVLHVGTISVKLPPKLLYEMWTASSINIQFYMIQGELCKMAQAVAAEAMISQQLRLSSQQSLDENVEEVWKELCSLPGTDSSYFTIQAKEEIREELEEEREKEKAKLAEENLQKFKLISVLPLESLEDAEVYGAAISALAESRPLNRESKVLLTKMMTENFEVTFQTDIPHPVDRNISLTQIANCMNCLSRTLANEMIGGNILFSELKEAEEFWHYNVTKPNPFIQYVNGSRSEVKEKVHQNNVETAQNLMKDEAESQVEMMKYITHTAAKYIVEDLMVGSRPMVIESNTGFEMFVQKSTMHDFNSQKDEENKQFHFPNGCLLLGEESDCNDNPPPLGTVAVRWSNVLEFRGSETVNLSPGSSSLNLSLTDRTGGSELTVQNLTELIEICLSLETSDEKSDTRGNSFTYVTPTFSKDDDFLVYHKLKITSNATVQVELIPDNAESPLMLMYGFGYKPSLFEYEERVQIKTLPNGNGIYSLLADVNGKLHPGDEFVLAVGHLANDLENPDSYFDGSNPQNLTRTKMTNEFSTNYSVRIFTTGCYYFVEEGSSWSSDGCVVKSANSSMVCCHCNHLTFFGSGFVVPPNNIDFDYVFSHTSFQSNLAIYCTLIVTFSLYIILLIWARWKDRKDTERIGASPLPDNDFRDKYLYEIVVQTGFQYNAGTKSKVYFIVSGEDQETDVRTLADDERPVFTRSSLDVFIMAVPRCLGQLNYLRIWHDNSGKGKNASWFVKYVIFKDLQTGLKYEFLVDCWFALEEGDGMIDRLIPVAGRQQTTEFSHLFPMASRRNLSDNHLWFSIFLRPVRSRFTRVQRLSCCMAVLYLSMLTSAMWYQTTPDQPSLGAFKLGPFSLSPEQIAIGLMSNLVVFPPSFLMIIIFRKSRPRVLRPSHVDEALKKQYRKWKKAYGENKENRNANVPPPQAQSPFDEESQMQRKVKKKFSLPWWCAILGWILVILSIGASIFFLWAYGLQFGDERTQKWLTSLVISFFSSVLLTEPIKIFLFALLMSCLCGNRDVVDDDADEDEETPYLNKDQEWLHQLPSGTTVRRPKYRPMDQKALETARKYRERELKMYSVVKELGAYALYLWVLTVLSYGNRDPNNFFMREAVINGFIKPGDLWNDFNKVNTERRFWNWTREALIPELFVGLWYNGRIPLGLRLFVDDRYNLKIGYPVLRQVRANQDNCKVPLQMTYLTEECAGFSSVIHEDGSYYAKFWSSDYTIESRIPPEYKYMTATDLNGFPFCGQIDWYGGGGYVVPLIAKRFEDGEKLIAKMTELEENGWIDKGTRAVFVEFGTYNAQVNLFVVVTIVAEFIPGGGVFPYYHIDPIKLLHYHTGSGLLQLVCQIGFLIFTIYYTYCQISAISKLGKKYFAEYWNIAELANLLAAYAGIIVEIYKLVITRRILDIFTETEGTGYIKLQEALLLDESFCYLIGFLMSLSTLKFLKVLRFNRRIGIMASTLNYCARELRSYGICLLLTFVAFVALFWMTLGKHMKEFCSFFRAFESAISMMLKKFNYVEMEAASPFIAPISFFTFALTASLVLVNILLTLIIQTYDMVKRDENLQSDDYELIPFVINRLKLTTGIGKPKVLPMPQLGTFPQGPEKLKKDIIGSFPGKVNKLVDFINTFYFDDMMDFTDKIILEKSAVNSYVAPMPAENEDEKPKKKPRKITRYQPQRIRKYLDF